VALELVTPYPADYHATVQQVVKENETGDLPPLKTKIDSMVEKNKGCRMRTYFRMIKVPFPIRDGLSKKVWTLNCSGY
jgi:hypothetical protein